MGFQERQRHRVYLARAEYTIAAKALEKGLKDEVHKDVREALQAAARDAWAYVKTCHATLEAGNMFPPMTR